MLWVKTVGTGPGAAVCLRPSLACMLQRIAVRTLGLQTCAIADGFIWVVGIQTQFFTLAWQVLPRRAISPAPIAFIW